MNRMVVKRLLDNVSIKAILWLLYAGASYLVAMYAVIPVVLGARLLGVEWDVSSTNGGLALRIVVYAFAIILLILGLKLARLDWPAIRKVAGFARNLDWKDLLLSAAGFIAYMLATTVVLSIVAHLPGFDAGQSQNVGVGKVYGGERLIAFLVLVVLTPIAEETMFRGIFYGYLRKLGVWRWVAVFIVSALFGLAHGQWNVGLDVFSLSVVLCILRELTGSIWAGVVVHMIKNFIAFYLLYFVM